MNDILKVNILARIDSTIIDVALDTSPGTLVIIGPNGAGKTSLLSLLLGANNVDNGNISIGDTVLLDTSRKIDVPLEYRRLGYVPQNYALFPHLTVYENIEFALTSFPTKFNKEELQKRILELLSDLNLEKFAHRRTQQLSGGEKQRVALARVLSVNPRALLLDEPLAALDVHARHEVREFLASYLVKLALPTLIVTHDARDAHQLGHRIAVLENGKITQIGTWDELVKNPASRFVEKFVASY